MMNTRTERINETWDPIQFSQDTDAHFQVALNEDKLDQPLRWRRPRQISVCPTGDLFHGNVPCHYIVHIWRIMAIAQSHIFQISTEKTDIMESSIGYFMLPAMKISFMEVPAWPLPNIWLGASIKEPRHARNRISSLLRTPAAIRFVSCEPPLGWVDLDLVYDDGPACCDGGTQDAPCGCHGAHQFLPRENGIDWVVCGAGTDPKARPMNLDWARYLRDQCREAGIPFFFKTAGLDKEIPKDLMIREWPE